MRWRGKGVLSIKQLQHGVAELTARGQAVFRTTLATGLTSDELNLIRFLTEDFAANSEAGTLELRKSTGLRRVR